MGFSSFSKFCLVIEVISFGGFWDFCDVGETIMRVLDFRICVKKVGSETGCRRMCGRMRLQHGQWRTLW